MKEISKHENGRKTIVYKNRSNQTDFTTSKTIRISLVQHVTQVALLAPSTLGQVNKPVYCREY